MGPSEMSNESCPEICVITYMSQFLSATMIVSRSGFLRDTTLSEQYRRESAGMYLYMSVGPEPVSGASPMPSRRPVHENRPLPAVPALEPEYAEADYLDPDDLPRSQKPCKKKSTFPRPPIPVPDNDNDSSWNIRPPAPLPVPSPQGPVETINQNSNEVRPAALSISGGRRPPSIPVSHKQPEPSKPPNQPGLPPPPPPLISRKPLEPPPRTLISMLHKRAGQAVSASPTLIATDDEEPPPPIPTRVTEDQRVATTAKLFAQKDEYSYVPPENTLSNKPQMNVPLTTEAEVTVTWPLRQYPATDIGTNIVPEAIAKPPTQYPRITIGKETTDANGSIGPMEQCWENDAQELLAKHPDLDKIIIQALRPPNTLELGTHEDPKHGNVADVYQARLYDIKMGLCMVAAKTMRDDGDEIHLLNEAALMMKLRHENVMCLYGLVLLDQKVYLLQPWMVNGDLKTYLESNGPCIKEQRLLVFALDIACAMEYLAERNIVHRDLAARNCLLDRVLRVKISDFTLSRDVFIQPYIRKTDMGMPYQTAALEVLEELKYTTMSDVWSFGVLLWEILTLGAEPYFNKMSSQITSFLLKGNRLPQPDNDKHNMYELMLECWDADPKKRPKFTQVFERIEETMLKIDLSYTPRMAMPTSGASYLMFQAPEMPVAHTQLGTQKENYYQLKGQK